MIGRIRLRYILTRALRFSLIIIAAFVVVRWWNEIQLWLQSKGLIQSLTQVAASLVAPTAQYFGNIMYPEGVEDMGITGIQAISVLLMLLAGVLIFVSASTGFFSQGERSSGIGKLAVAAIFLSFIWGFCRGTFWLFERGNFTVDRMFWIWFWFPVIQGGVLIVLRMFFPSFFKPED